MRLPDTEQTSRPWRIHELTAGFRLVDVWELPTPGGPGDFPRLVQLIAESDPVQVPSRAVRTLFEIRWKIGALLGWDDPAPRPGAAPRPGPEAAPGPEADPGAAARPGPDQPTLRDRLPADLRDAPSGPAFATVPFTPLYLTGDEWAAEIVNRTVHGVMHIGWVPDQAGGYRGQMAIYARPNGLLGTGYLAAITPFRHLIVYPSMLRAIGQAWQALPGHPALARE